jgi:geranylgeranyl diphosphate synthase type I
LLSARARAVDARVTSTLAATSGAIVAAGAPAAEIMEQIAQTSLGGKRLRAQLIIAACDAHGSADSDAAVGIGAAVELFQTAALLHDDVLDDSDTRRGRPAAHRALASLHRSNHWMGDGDSFGAAAGILAGDLALIAAHRALANATALIDEARGSTVRTLFADMAELVTVGQYLDMRVAAQPLSALPDQESAIRDVMRTKTASYSAEFPLALGAACAGASAEQIDAVRAIGVPVGVAFQLRDDVLGLTGSPEVTGKPAGDDIREGKRTMLVWRAWTVADDAGRGFLRQTLGRRDASNEDVRAAVAQISTTDAIDRVEVEIDALARNAVSQLERLALRPAATELLVTLIHAATNRTS